MKYRGSKYDCNIFNLENVAHIFGAHLLPIRPEAVLRPFINMKVKCKGQYG